MEEPVLTKKGTSLVSALAHIRVGCVKVSLKNKKRKQETVDKFV